MPDASSSPAPDSSYRIASAEERRADAAFLQRWRALLSASASPEKIFQSPEFYDYLASNGEAVELLAVSDGDGAIAGIIPVWLRDRSIDFQLGARTLASMAVPGVVLLGSVPLLPADPVLRTQLLDQLFAFLLARFPRCQAIALTALPEDSWLWRCMRTPEQFSRRHYALHLQDDWRDCHQIPLPGDFNAYLAQFNAKKRYNLKRQMRLLREHGQGRLALHCIERPDQVAQLSAALGRLAAPAHRRRLLSDRTLHQFAERGMLLCYVMECDGQAGALMLGVSLDGVLHLYNIFHDSALDHLSAGTAILHLAIEDLCGRRRVRLIDFGYGTPAHQGQAGNTTVRRAHALLLRPSMKNRAVCWLHRHFCAAVASIKRRRQH